MKQLFERIRQCLMPRGVWVAYDTNFTGFAFFEDELPCRRYASDNTMDVAFVRFGFDVRQEILRRP